MDNVIELEAYRQRDKWIKENSEEFLTICEIVSDDPYYWDEEDDSSD